MEFVILTIKCAACGKKLFKYLKIGKGKILKCYKTRINKKYQDNKGDYYNCKCGNIIGVDEGSYFKMKQKAFVFTGTKD